MSLLGAESQHRLALASAGLSARAVSVALVVKCLYFHGTFETSDPGGTSVAQALENLGLGSK